MFYTLTNIIYSNYICIYSQKCIFTALYISIIYKCIIYIYILTITSDIPINGHVNLSMNLIPLKLGLLQINDLELSILQPNPVVLELNNNK